MAHLTCVKLLHPLGCWQQLGGVNFKKQCINLQLHCGIRFFQYDSDASLSDSLLSDVSFSFKSRTVLLNGATLALSDCKSMTVLLDGLVSSSCKSTTVLLDGLVSSSCNTKSQTFTAVDSSASGVVSPGGCTNDDSCN